MTHQERANEILKNGDLLAFADEFSKTYRKVSTTAIVSDGESVTVEFGARPDQKAVIHKVTRTIKLNKSVFLNEGYTSDFMFYLILWLKVEVEIDNIHTTDEIVTKYYLTTGRSHTNLLRGMILFLSHLPTEIGIERISSMKNQLKQ
jgi:hypothetical protein